jgi:hypothetical protein
MSALPPKADMDQHDYDVRLVPTKTKDQGEQNREDDHDREIDTDISVRTLVSDVTWEEMTHPAGQFLSGSHLL